MKPIVNRPAAVPEPFERDPNDLYALPLDAPDDGAIERARLRSQRHASVLDARISEPDRARRLIGLDDQ